MYKNTTFREKFQDLSDWMPYIIETVKKDLKQDHLKKDFYFMKKFFSSTNINKISSQEMTDAYSKSIQEEEKGEQIGEFVASRWLLKNSDLYAFFEKKLSAIAPDFTNIEEIELHSADQLAREGIDAFGPIKTYLFCVLNSVVFPKSTYDFLKDKAKAGLQALELSEKEHLDRSSQEALESSFKATVARLTDKYEKKISGLEKKYITDVEQLKKQIALLQRKLHELQQK